MIVGFCVKSIDASDVTTRIDWLVSQLTNRVYSYLS
jgi:hypothetical protein